MREGRIVDYCGVGRVGAVALLVTAVMGCRPEAASQPRAPGGPAGVSPAAEARSVVPARRITSRRAVQRPQAAEASPRPDRPEPPSVSNGMLPAAARRPPQAAVLPKVTSQKLVAAGLRQLEGQHLVLYTDLPVRPAVDELPRVFDLAVEQWCTYFQIPPERVATWKIAGCLMGSADPFREVGLLAEDLPPFLHGFQRGVCMWMYEKPSDYYRRHIVLHEGTHAFMNEVLGGSGPAWYSEGMAELLGTHHWQDGHLQLAYFPRDRDEVVQWGRIKVVQEAVLAGQGLTLADVRGYGPTAHLRVEPYAWCWAACAFLDGHPAYRGPFRQLAKWAAASAPAFRRAADELLPWAGPRLSEQWQLFTHDLDYGYDLAREAVLYREARPWDGRAEAEVLADRGWQSTGLLLEGPGTYLLEAAGRYQIARTTVAWPCEPGGVTIRYFAGRPLGVLLAACEPPEGVSDGPTPLLRPVTVGLRGEVSVEATSVLFLRVNDAPAELADNAGQATIRIRRLPPGVSAAAPD